MDDKTSKLIEQLAVKLGTTAEYLWTILLKQAKISAINDIIFLSVSLLFGFILFRIHRYLLKERKVGGYEESYYHKYEEAAILPMVIFTVAFTITFIISLSSISNIINGLLNPEYWALKEILDTIK